ncbi:hypothetical protein FB451DRAFT_1447153 [Mycena latifolia]|nr:hypothetical protein FB451DRAFT_1447153 [Mycena latifolia]
MTQAAMFIVAPWWDDPAMGSIAGNVAARTRVHKPAPTCPPRSDSLRRTCPLAAAPDVDAAAAAAAAADARASVAHLLTRASSYPSSAATPAFARLAASTSTLQLALDALLPILDPPIPAELTDSRSSSSRCKTPPNHDQPVQIRAECERALALAGSGVAPNEPLVWVLWKILEGDGDDIGPYSPSALAHTLLPPNFRATKLILDESLYHTPPKSDLDDVTYPSDTAPVATADALAERTITSEEDVRGEAIAHVARARPLPRQTAQKVMPVLPTLGGTALLAPRDLAPLAAPLFAALLATPSVTSSELSPSEPSSSTSLSPPDALSPAATPYLAALSALPPTLPTFDVP